MLIYNKEAISMGKMENNIKKGIIESYAFRLKALGLSFK